LEGLPRGGDLLLSGSRRFERYVVLGDSTAEGLDDPDGRGGYRGWADRLAERIAAGQGSLLYANVAVRGRTTRRVLEEQLAPALAMRPDLALVVAGTNDLLRPRFDAEAVARDMERMQRALVEAGATVVSFTLPDLGPVMPLARPLRPRIHRLARALTGASARSGAILVDFAPLAFASDPRLWSEDRLHANAAGHARIADALAHALSLPGSSDSWRVPLPPPAPTGSRSRLAAELRWTRLHLLPWLSRHARGRSSGDGRGPKRPELRPVEPSPPSVVE
jgi:lysophospholipase L1-like esterase